MSDATKDRDTSKGGFSSRWILDGERRPTTVAGDARAAASAIDTDGDGVADTLAVRVDTERQSGVARFFGWVGRSLLTILFVAALVAAAVAATSMVQAREDRAEAIVERDAARGQLAEVERDLDAAEAKVATLTSEAASASTDATALETERDELELEVRVLRRMLLDAERRAASATR
jgi:hypothetical protein